MCHLGINNFIALDSITFKNAQNAFLIIGETATVCLYIKCPFIIMLGIEPLPAPHGHCRRKEYIGVDPTASFLVLVRLL